MKIVKANKAYLEDINKIEFDNFINDDFYSSNQIEECINDNNYIFNLLVNEHNQLIGFLIATNNTDHIDLCQIVIDKKLQGNGFGLLLLQSLNQYILPIFIEVNEDNTNAIKFYLKNNFKEISKRQNYYKDKKCIVMRKDY